MNTNHEPWYTHKDSGFLYESEHARNPLAVFANPEHAKRIVACVNACAGIDTYCLENHSFRAERDACLKAIEELKAERDTARAAASELAVKFTEAMSALRGVLPYALSRAEDLAEAKSLGEEDPAFPGADAACAAVEAASRIVEAQDEEEAQALGWASAADARKARAIGAQS